jgi:group I intron endonuclease
VVVDIDPTFIEAGSDTVGPCTYYILHPASNNFYVGSTCNFKRRHFEHWHRLKKGTHSNPRLQDLFVTNSELVFAVTLHGTTKDAVEHEGKMLSAFADDPRLLNVKLTADYHTLERREKISLSLQGHPVSLETRELIGSLHAGNKYWVGRKHKESSKVGMRLKHMGNTNAKGHVKTPEGREKIRQTHLGRIHGPEAREKMSRSKLVNKPVSVDGVEYYNYTVAGKAIGKSGDTIRRRVLDDRFPTYFDIP